jgi:hypothetical protein
MLHTNPAGDFGVSAQKERCSYWRRLGAPFPGRRTAHPTFHIDDNTPTPGIGVLRVECGTDVGGKLLKGVENRGVDQEVEPMLGRGLNHDTPPYILRPSGLSAH